MNIIVLWTSHFALIVCGKCVCVCTHDNLNAERALGIRLAFLKDMPHCFRKLTPDTTHLSLPLPSLKSVVCGHTGLGFSVDMHGICVLNQGRSKMSSFTVIWIMTVCIPVFFILHCSAHTLYLKMLFLLLFPEASPFYLELYKSTNESSPLWPGGAALWFAVVLGCVLRDIMLLCK